MYSLNSLAQLTTLFVIYNASKPHPKTLEPVAGAPSGARARGRGGISHLSAAVASESVENEGSYLWIRNPSLFLWNPKLSLSLSTSSVMASCFPLVSVQHRKPHHWVPEEARNRWRYQTVRNPRSLSFWVFIPFSFCVSLVLCLFLWSDLIQHCEYDLDWWPYKFFTVVEQLIDL